MENSFCSERNRNSLTPNPSPKARGDLPSGWLPPLRGSRWGASGELEGGFFASFRVELSDVGPPIIWKTVHYCPRKSVNILGNLHILNSLTTV